MRNWTQLTWIAVAMATAACGSEATSATTSSAKDATATADSQGDAAVAGQDTAATSDTAAGDASTGDAQAAAQDTASADTASADAASDTSTADTSAPSYPPATRVAVGRAFIANDATICIFRQDAEPWCWGLDIQGQVFGTGAVSLVKGQTLPIKDVVDFAASNAAACALKKDGTLWCVGNANMPGTGNNAPWTQVKLPGFPSLKAIYGANAGFAALATNGEVYGFGQSLGFGGPFTDGPKQVDTGVAQVLSGMAASIFLKDSQPDNVIGNLGWEVPNYEAATPVTAPFEIVGGNPAWDNTILLAKDGALWGIGRDDGKLSNGTGAWKEWKQLSAVPGAVEVVAHSMGGCALTGAGEVHCFGMGAVTLGRPPQGDGYHSPGPVQVDGKPLTGIAHIYGGMSTMLALGKDGSVWLWGFGPHPNGGAGGFNPTKVYPPAN